MAAAVHTLYRSGVWMFELEGEGRATRCASKAEAVAAGYARAALLGADHLIHNHDGSIAQHGTAAALAPEQPRPALAGAGAEPWPASAQAERERP